MFKALSDYIFYYRPAFRFIALLNGTDMGDYLGTNELKREVPVIISFSSDEKHFDDLGFTIHSLLSQNIKPDRVILWLKDEYELSMLPYSVTKYIKNGLEIRFVKDKGDYMPIYYGFKEFGNSIIVQASDKVIYPADWLEKLYHSYISYPKEIHVNQAFDIGFKEEKRKELIITSEFVQTEDAKYTNLPVLSGGLLFPPNCFVRDVLREDIYKNKLEAAPNMWLWCMAVVSGRKIRVVKSHKKVFRTTQFFAGMADYVRMCKNPDELNKRASRLSEYYCQNLKKGLES